MQLDCFKLRIYNITRPTRQQDEQLLLIRSLHAIREEYGSEKNRTSFHNFQKRQFENVEKHFCTRFCKNIQNCYKEKCMLFDRCR